MLTISALSLLSFDMAAQVTALLKFFFSVGISVSPGIAFWGKIKLTLMFLLKMQPGKLPGLHWWWS